MVMFFAILPLLALAWCHYPIFCITKQSTKAFCSRCFRIMTGVALIFSWSIQKQRSCQSARVFLLISYLACMAGRLIGRRLTGRHLPVDLFLRYEAACH